VGWVRNRHDGSVELLLAGDAERLDAYAAWLPHGVPFARVDAIESIDAQAPELRRFERRPTA
jgi:acylphosphatase